MDKGPWTMDNGPGTMDQGLGASQRHVVRCADRQGVMGNLGTDK